LENLALHNCVKLSEVRCLPAEKPLVCSLQGFPNFVEHGILVYSSEQFLLMALGTFDLARAWLLAALQVLLRVQAFFLWGRILASSHLLDNGIAGMT
jgi:hypothetical protein